MKIFLGLLTLLLPNAIALAATASTLTINGVGESSSQITVYGDPDSNVELHYGKYASQTSSLGSTAQNGYLTLTISTASYSIACGNTAYVIVNGQRSQTISWSAPGSTVCSTAQSDKFSFSDKDIVMTVGETRIITVNGSGGYKITENSSPIIGATISSNTLTLHARAFGGSALTICDSQEKCNVLYVVALYPTPAAPAPSQPTQPTTPVTPPVATPVAKYTFKLFLNLDSEGSEVTELQKKLTSLGFYSGPVTGYFGPLTRAAVIKFQKAKGIEPLGHVGPSTRVQLNK